MKIVHALYTLEMGGAEMLVGQLCRLQRANGHEVSVCVYEKLGIIGEALRADGFDVFVAGEAPPSKTMVRYFHHFRRIKPDVVHCHNPAATFHAAFSARFAGVRSVIATRHRLEPLPYNRPLELKFSLASRFCNWVTGISQITCDMAKNAPMAARKKIVLVYNGTTPVAEVSSAERVAKKGFTLLFIGRLAPEKDLGTLIRGVALAAKRLPDLQLWIVGDGRVRPELETIAAAEGVTERVTFWGERMDTAQFFRSADTFAMSSVTEGLPVSLLQAMSAGLPAILTDVDGGAEILRISESGLLVPLQNPAGMADAIVQMAGDALLREEFSRKALATYESRFTLERMNDGYMKLYAG